jgi:hypothetical protein
MPAPKWLLDTDHLKRSPGHAQHGCDGKPDVEVGSQVALHHLRLPPAVTFDGVPVHTCLPGAGCD